jgi:hypothetical protein
MNLGNQIIQRQESNGMKMGKFVICSPAERRSRKRVKAFLENVNTTPKAKCSFLNSELGRAMNSAFVSEKWTDEIFDTITAIMNENNLTPKDFF